MYCNNCGNQISEDTGYCGRCGSKAKVKMVDSILDRVGKSHKKDVFLPVMVVLSVVAVISAGVLIFMLTRDDKPADVSLNSVSMQSKVDEDAKDDLKESSKKDTENSNANTAKTEGKSVSPDSTSAPKSDQSSDAHNRSKTQRNSRSNSEPDNQPDSEHDNQPATQQYVVVNYSTGTVPSFNRILWPKDRGDDVRTLQAYLNAKFGFVLEVDGILGTYTQRAIKAVQKVANRNGFDLVVDGAYGMKTTAALSYIINQIESGNSRIKADVAAAY